MDESQSVNPEKPPTERAEPEWSGIGPPEGGIGRGRLKADKLHVVANADERWEAPDDSWSSHAEEEGAPGDAPRGLGARLRRLFGLS